MTEVGGAFDLDRFLAGDQTPVLFGSALTNFGIGPFLDALAELLPPPGPRASDRGLVPPDDPDFSGFIFKIQANMDPRHRDRMAFLRVCSGRFEKDMEVFNPRLGRTVRLTRPHRLFGQDRETVEEAFPGDVVGLVNPGLFAIGDTLCAGEPVQFTPVPRFPPECFARIENRSTGRHKQFHAGLAQLEEEGAIQVLFSIDGAREPILAAVGDLQLDVTAARLRGEYGVEADVQPAPLRNRALGGRRRRRRQRAQLADARRAAHRGPRRPSGRPLRLRLGPPLHRREEPGGRVPGDRVRRG